MSAFETAYLVLAVGCFTGFWLVLFVTWVRLEVLAPRTKPAPLLDSHGSDGHADDRKAA